MVYRLRGFGRASTLLLLSAPLAVAAPMTQEEETQYDSVQDALGNGTTWVNLRYRFEHVDQDSFDKDARASTLRTILGYESGVWDGFSVLLEAEDVSVVGNDLYNSTVNSTMDRPVVADPDGTEVNQAYLQYGGFEDTTLRAGRQRIALSNKRFIGNVGWRQNEQTYDAWTVTTEAVEGLTLIGSQIYNVNRVLGESSPVGDFDSSIFLLHAIGEFEDVGTLNAYYYDLDLDSAATLSSTTIGASLDGGFDVDALACSFRVEFATQSDTGDNPADVDASYTNLELGADVEGVELKLGLELLEGSGDPGDKFTTPLATAHAFNGWADKFLATPDDGLEDLYFSVGGTWRGTRLQAVYHDFSPDAAGDDYGSEVDLLASRTFECGVVGGLKLASYSADAFDEDTTKAWFWLGYSF